MKNNNKQKGFATSFIVILIGVILVAGAVLYYKTGWQQKDITPSQNQTSNQVSETQDMPSNTVVAENKTYTVEITATSFNPKTLEIKKGDTVTFVNKDTAKHWPASDLHPSHKLCPGFDALHGLTQGEIYSYTFNEAKTCIMHDHMHPSLTGAIIIQ